MQLFDVTFTHFQKLKNGDCDLRFHLQHSIDSRRIKASVFFNIIL